MTTVEAKTTENDTTENDTTANSASTAVELDAIELALTGMTCASCANRIERKLNKLDGVSATVNYATEKARVEHPDSVTPQQLVETVENAGYGASVIERERPRDEGAADSQPTDVDTLAETPADARVRDLRQRLVISAALALPVVLMAMIPPLQFTNWQWLSLTLAAPVVVWGAYPFHRAAWTNLRHGATTMDTLVSVGTLAAFAWSLYALFFGDAGMAGMKHGFDFGVSRGHGSSNLYLEAASGVTVFVLLGRYIEARSKRAAGAALRALLDLGAKDAAVLRGADGREREERVPVSALVVGDRFVVRPGEKIATDGVVVSGDSAVDAAMVTGESVPVDVTPGDAVIGATTNVSGRLVVQASRVGSDTQLAQMAKLVEEAQNGKAEAQRLADRISGIFVPIVISLALLTLIGWLVVTHDVEAAFTAAVSVLIIACPCALGLATPTALMVGTGRGAQLGILFRGPQVLEATHRIDTVVLDKTGTVTSGEMTAGAVIAASGESEDEVLRVAAALESASEHPIAQAVAGAGRARFGSLAEVEGFANLPGQGVTGRVQLARGGVREAGATVEAVVGRPSALAERGMPLDADLTREFERLEARGGTVVAVGWNGVAHGVIAVSDAVKPTSASAVAELSRLGLPTVLLTGDNEQAARAVAQEVGIDDVVAGVLPAGKVDVVMRLQGEGRVVAMVGDGVNDAPALAQADLGLAMGTGTDAAIEASDVTLVRGDLRLVGDAVRLGRKTLRTIKSNLFWAFAYNVAAIPLAAAGLLNPMIAGAAMAFSSVFVVLNSLRLRGFDAGRSLAD